ncbi:hypothetical protein CO731_05096 [Aminobacter sp. MSH1]|uniref:hypothetical protein n=1 Tax=Aminobacter sp. MSH1 TaxID=374606 RepID=UPI000D349DF1|nr:hypothetical protein [Aminobacter sp. MSH1]AWC25597.1 hypothetical protein CO731_05096 [Aminobacter sp. MSH1]
MTDQLSLYNGALILLGQPRLSALTDEGKGRRALDFAYAKTVKVCLEAGLWNFAMRFRKAETSPSVDSTIGFKFVFDKPDDWLRTAAMTVDAHGRRPLLEYDDRTDFWLADIDTIFVRYISSDPDFGLDLGRWPESFVAYVETSLAVATCEEITGSNEKMDRLSKAKKEAWKTASNRDVMNEPVTKFPPTGRLVASRGGGLSREHGRR